MRRAALAVCGLIACTALAGCARPQAQALSPPGQQAFELSLAADDRQLVAAWNGGESGNAIWIRLTEAGKPVGLPIRLTDGKRDAYEPDIRLLDGDLLLAWYDKDAASGALTARLGRFSLQGQLRWQIALSAPQASGRNAVVRVHDGQALAAWIETPAAGEPAVWTARVGADGQYLQPARQAATVSAETWNLNAAVDGKGTFLLVYDARIGTRAKELHLLTVGAAGTEERLLSSDDGHDSMYPDLALADDRMALTWFDTRDGNAEVYLFAGKLADLRASLDSRAARITSTAGESTGAYLAWNGARLGLAWCEDIKGQSEVFSQQFDASGAALGAAQRVTDNATQSSIPAIRPWRDGFALAWNEYQSEDADGHPAIIASTAMLSLR